MFVKECPSINTCGRKGDGVEQELSCNASPKTASANSLGSCGAKAEALSVAHPQRCSPSAGPFYPISH